MSYVIIFVLLKWNVTKNDWNLIKKLNAYKIKQQ